MQQQQQSSIKVFYAYAEEDQPWRDQIATHLSQLTRDGIIESWHHQQIPAGADRTQTIHFAH